MSERDELLRRVLTGELAQDDPAVRACAAKDAGFAAELRELVDLSQSLERAGGVVQRDKRVAAELVQPAREERLEETLRRLADAGGPARERVPPTSTTVAHRRRLGGALVMVAAVVLLFLAWRLRTPPAALPIPHDGGRLGGDGGVVLTAPLDSGSDFAAFGWQAPPEAVWFELVVSDAATGAVLERGEELRGTAWTPASDTERWPPTIRWELTAFGRSGETVGFAVGQATR